MNYEVKQYIDEQKANTSRYEIDRFLLSKSHNAEEIETVWKEVLKPPVPLSFFRRNAQNFIILLLSFLSVTLSIFFWSYPRKYWFFAHNEESLRFWALVFEIIVLIVILAWKKNKKYDSRYYISIFITSLLVTSLATLCLFSTAILNSFDTPANSNETNITIKGYDYHFYVKNYVFDDSYNVIATLFKCKPNQVLCPVEKEINRAKGDDIPSTADILLKYDAVSDKVNIVLHTPAQPDKILYSTTAT